MTEQTTANAPRVNEMMAGITGSEILKVAYEVQGLIASGKRVANYTIGDFDSSAFRIPRALEDGVVENYREALTNYPRAMGMDQLRDAVVEYYRNGLGVDYQRAGVVVGSGVRPLIYSTYLTVVEPGEGIVFSYPCWNTRAYTRLCGGKELGVAARPENNFLLTAAEIKPRLGEAALVALCSPANPSGTMYDPETLGEICDLMLAENRKRLAAGRKPVYLLYDHVYWQYTFDRPHAHPVGVRPEMQDYTIYTDGMSKSFAATGLRVGWGVGPEAVMPHISDLVGFIGAWAPKPEQLASADWLVRFDDHKTYFESLLGRIGARLSELSEGLLKMGEDGLGISCIPPQGGLFLSINAELKGKQTPAGETLNTSDDIRRYLLHEGGTAFVPFSAFDAPESDAWFRASVSSLPAEDVSWSLGELRAALERLK